MSKDKKRKNLDDNNEFNKENDSNKKLKINKVYNSEDIHGKNGINNQNNSNNKENILVADNSDLQLSKEETNSNYILENNGSEIEKQEKLITQDNNTKENNKSKQYTTVATQTDIKEFRVALESNKVEDFMTKFISFNQRHKHNVLSKDDAYSLLLNAAISYKNIDVVKHILSMEHKENILTSMNMDYDSPVSYALRSKNEEILGLIHEYMSKTSAQIEKTNLIAKDQENLLPLMKYVWIKDITPFQCLHDYLLPIYTEESLSELVKLSGNDELLELANEYLFNNQDKIN